MPLTGMMALVVETTAINTIAKALKLTTMSRSEVQQTPIERKDTENRSRFLILKIPTTKT